MVRMQMRQQHMHRRGIRVPLQRAEHTPAEVDNQRRCVRRSEQIPPTQANPAPRRYRSIRARLSARTLLCHARYNDAEYIDAFGDENLFHGLMNARWVNGLHTTEHRTQESCGQFGKRFGVARSFKYPSCRRRVMRTQ